MTPELAVFDRVRQRMAQNLDRLPNYTCLETIERSSRLQPKRELLFSDRVRLEVAFIGRKEMFSWPGSQKFEYSSPGQMVAGGASGFGTFGAFVDTIFRSSAPVFNFAGENSLDRRRTLQFNFRVPMHKSTFKVNIGGQEAIVPYSGSVWVDPEALGVVRLEVRAGQSGLPVTSVTRVIDYATMRIGSSEFLLPRSSELTIVDLESVEHRNLSRFTGCRQYAVESSISFEVPDETAPASDEGAPEITLPAAVTLDVKLESKISFEQSAVGDQVTARLGRAVQAGGVPLPKGATLSGRIRRLDRYYRPEKYMVVGLEFSSMTFGGRRAVFHARLVGPALKMRERRDSPYNDAPMVMGIESSGLDIDASDPAARFSTFRIWTGTLRLPRGLRMIWETQVENPPPVAAVAVSSGTPPLGPQAEAAVQPPPPALASSAQAPKTAPPVPVQPARPEPSPVIRVTTRLVEVHVIVGDQKGKPVRGLTREDFVLLDKEQPQQITSFSVESSWPSPAPPASAPQDVFSNAIQRGSDRPFTATVVLFDKLNTRSENQNYAKLELLKFLKKTGSLERVAIYILEGRLRVLVDFTGDTETLTRSLAQVHGQKSSELDAYEPARPETMTARFKWVEREMGYTDRSIATLATQARAEYTLRALEAIGQHLSRVPGRKNLIWISDVFPVTMGGDASDLLARAERGERPAPMVMSLSPQIARTARILTDANVAVYPIEARGLAGVAGADAADAVPVIEGDTSLVIKTWRTMDVLAEDTGGRAFHGSNDISECIRQAFEDAGSVYVLGYAPAHNEWDGRFRRIEVRVKRAGLKLRYRRGYFAVSTNEETAEQRDTALLAASSIPLDATGIGLTARVTLPQLPKGHQWNAAITVDARDLSLETMDANWLGALDLLFVQRASDGKEVSVIKSELPIRWDRQSYDAHLADGIRLIQLLDVMPVATQLRIVVRDRRSGKLGSLSIPMDRIRRPR